MNGNIGVIRDAIVRGNIQEAQGLLISMLASGDLQYVEHNIWGKLAGEIENKLGGDFSKKEKFWDNLRKVICQKERKEKRRVHKGLIYFKVGVHRLVQGRRSFNCTISWLNKAYAEDKIFYPAPENESAYRLLALVRAFIRFKNAIRDPESKGKVNNIVKNHAGKVGKLFCRIYDHSVLVPAPIAGLNWEPFDLLLGRNPYRTLVQEKYEAALYLCAEKGSIKAKDLVKDGLAQAVIVLCGATIEGILLNMRTVRASIRKKNRKHPSFNLSGAVKAYILKSKSYELVVSLIFIWFARDLIHPEVARRHKKLIVDMNFADFVRVLSEYVIGSLAKNLQATRLSHSPVR